MKILVLYGGDSPEREVSMRSAKSVTAALKELDLEFDVCDPKDGFDVLKKACLNSDIVLPILHGINGEDGVIQDFLESLNKKYLGANADVSRITFDKHKTHQSLEKIGIKMPVYEIVDKNSFESSVLTKKPYVLKPICGGSSIDTVIVRKDIEGNRARAYQVLNKYDNMLIEELIEGIEISAPVLGNNALPLINIIPPDGEEFDYKNKYNGASQEICPVPASILSTEMAKKIQEIVVKAHNHLNIEHLSRSEFMVNDNGDIYMLEINTIPGLTDASLYPKAASVAGYDMPKLVKTFIEMVGRS